MNTRKVAARDVKKGMVLRVAGVGPVVVAGVDTSSGTTLVELVGRNPLVFHPARKLTVIDAPTGR